MRRVKVWLIFAFLTTPWLSFAQNSDSTKVINQFGGAITVTTKGISTIPNFTLGKPAAVFELSMGRRMDDRDGVYLNAALNLAKRNFPLSVSSLINKPFRTNIEANTNLLWNVSLIYTFNNECIER